MNHLLPYQAAKLLDVTPERVRQLCDSGRLPCERGTLGIRLIDREAVERLAKERQRDRATAGR